MRSVKFVPREEIEDKRWNGCVHYAINGLPYAYTWYLDNVAEFWDGLVWGDYEAVFPLVHQTVGNAKMLYQPALAAELGLFSLKPIDKRLMTEFMEAIPAEYTVWDFNLNSMNLPTIEATQYTPHHSWYINLQPIYSEQQDRYNQTVVDALKKTESLGLRIKQDLKPEIVVEHFKNTTGKTLNLPESAYHSMHRIIYQAQHFGVGGGFGMSHVGWGMNPGAKWVSAAMYDKRDMQAVEFRALPGSFLWSTGANQYAGRYTLGHFDLPMRNCTISLDGRVVVKAGVLQGDLAL